MCRSLLRLSNDDGSSAQEQTRGVPGAALLPYDMQAIELKPLKIFNNGEVVAWNDAATSTLRYGMCTHTCTCFNIASDSLDSHTNTTCVQASCVHAQRAHAVA